MMKKTAYLINAARGPLVDERALVHALREKWIAGAALDVYENEPALTPGLSELDNVVVVPHIGSASKATREKMAIMAATNLVAGLKGEVPPNLVNKEVIAK
jgi:glyoxylate reductase